MESAYRGALLLAVAGELQPSRSAASWRRPLVLFGQHDRDHTLRDGRIGRVGRVVSERFVVVIDLGKDRLALDLKPPESCS